MVLAENNPPGQALPPGVLSRITQLTAAMSELVHKVCVCVGGGGEGLGGAGPHRPPLELK